MRTWVRICEPLDLRPAAGDLDELLGAAAGEWAVVVNPREPEAVPDLLFHPHQVNTDLPVVVEGVAHRQPGLGVVQLDLFGDVTKALIGRLDDRGRVDEGVISHNESSLLE